MIILLTSCVAILGGCIGLKLRVPAGALIGAMIATAVLNIAFNAAYMPAELKFYTQVATGAYIGAKISKADLRKLRKIIWPALLLVVIMMTFSIAVSGVIYYLSDMTIATALFSMAPAGVTDMTLASMDFDTEPSVVALIQTLRITFTVALLPCIIKWIKDRWHITVSGAVQEASVFAGRKKTWHDLGLTCLIALLAGGLGKFLRVPGGAIAFSMIGCAGFNLVTNRGNIPLNLRRFIQMFAGALIGCTIGRAQIIQVLELRGITVIAIVSFFLLDLVAAVVISHLFHIDIITALFACAPGGVTDMALIAEDLGADSVRVTGMHMIRLVGIVALYPAIISMLLNLFPK